MGPVPGAYASARDVPRDWLVRLPPSVEEEMAAALLLKGITADYLLHDLGRVRPGARWLVHAAAGGVGSILCQWGARLGARIVGTVSSQEKARQARNLGCEHVIVTSEYRFAESLKYHFPEGAEVIVDGLGAAAAGENFQALADCGHWISLGQVSGAPEPIAPDLLARKSASFSRPVAFAYVATRGVLEMRARRLWSALDAGSFQRPPIERFALAQAADAHLRLESRASSGSIVLLP
jgi:NADPH:quinone reductase-like Zn-dependent oxidoreductase